MVQKYRLILNIDKTNILPYKANTISILSKI